MFTLLSTMLPSGNFFATNLPFVFTHPAGDAPSGAFSKSFLYGSCAATRTRARAVIVPILNSTYPCWLGFFSSVSVPPSILPASGGGCAPLGCFAGVTMLHVCGGSGRLLFTSRPLASTKTRLNFTASPGLAVTSAGNSRAPAIAFGLNSASAGIGGYFASVGFAPGFAEAVQVGADGEVDAAVHCDRRAVRLGLLPFSWKVYSNTSLALGAFLPSSGMMDSFPFTSKM